MENLNLCNNLLAGESGDAPLFLVKENRSITKCTAENNMIKFNSLVELERICKHNKKISDEICLPEIRKEIKGLRKQKAEQGLFVEDLDKIKEQLKQQKADIARKLVEMENVEDKMQVARNTMSLEMTALHEEKSKLDERMNELAAEDKVQK